jgi:uncharacterized protein YyaL (SSP411 family)
METNAKHTNQLIKETSPYLLQHAHNPVDWFPWGDEAFQKAKKENKLVLISIGYSACHWCHVMERESFESEEMAKIMNELYVCIKVDREERPDVDQVYMSAVQMIAGSGGWPLNCFALPDGRPVFGGTYFRPKDFKMVLESLALTYKTEPHKVLDSAKSISEGISQPEIPIHISPSAIDSINIKTIINAWKSNFDTQLGGYKRAPKFALPTSWNALLEYAFHTKNESVSKQVEFTLEEIAKGGIYDHVGGAFARYSVDEYWKVPHFEKMLYDNAQLISLYSRAYQYFRNSFFKQIVEKSLAFLEKEMLSPDGGFYAAYDADSEGVEGKYYVFDASEIDELMGDFSPLFKKFFNITEEGNWEGSNILFMKEKLEDFCKQESLNSHEFEQKVKEAKEKLYDYRLKRIKPGLDNKILLSWNAQMMKAYCDAYSVFKKEEYKIRAQEQLDFLLKKFYTEEKLIHAFSGAKAIPAFLDDYALLIEALISAYQISFNESYLLTAKELNEKVLEDFFNTQTGLFYYTASDTELIVRKTEIMDNVIPSSNSIMAHNLLSLAKYFGISEYRDMAETMLGKIAPKLEKYPSYFGNWFSLLKRIRFPEYELVISDENPLQALEEVNDYLPHILLAGVNGDVSKIPLCKDREFIGNTQFFLCKEQTCELPESNLKDCIEKTLSK